MYIRKGKGPLTQRDLDAIEEFKELLRAKTKGSDSAAKDDDAGANNLDGGKGEAKSAE